MPVYCYKCKDCDTSFEVRHSMSFEKQRCLLCKSENVFKVPSISENTPVQSKKVPGKIVDQYISDAKKEINKEKKMLRSKEL